MKTTLLISLAAAALAQPNYGSGNDCKATGSVPAPPAYTSGVPASKAPCTAGFKDATVGISRGGNAVCVDGTIRVSATAENTKFNFQVPANESVVTDTFLKFVTAGTDFLGSITAGKQSISGTYDIRATLCTAKNNTAPKKVQLATHGVGFDRTYWDFARGYSYVDTQVKNGWAVLIYDRLGVGQSQHPDPIAVVQAPLEVSILNSIATSLRNGGLSDIKFEKVVGVGHSFGSILSNAVTLNYPKTLDAVVLTGFSLNASAVPLFTLANNFDIARANSPQRFGSLNNGYLVSSTVISVQYAFFRLPQFDAAILAAADASKNTVTFGEYFTLASVIGPAPAYTGPLAVVNGDSDLPFCTGNCRYPVDQAAAVKAIYPGVPATQFASYLAPSTGHGLNLHYTADAAFSFVSDFLKKNGL